MRRVLGSELRVGDVVEVWWRPNRDTITRLEPYRGVHEKLFKQGAQIASFAILRSGMTIDNADVFNVVDAPSRP